MNYQLSASLVFCRFRWLWDSYCAFYYFHNNCSIDRVNGIIYSQCKLPDLNWLALVHFLSCIRISGLFFSSGFVTILCMFHYTPWKCVTKDFINNINTAMITSEARLQSKLLVALFFLVCWWLGAHDQLKDYGRNLSILQVHDHS